MNSFFRPTHTLSRTAATLALSGLWPAAAHATPFFASQVLATAPGGNQSATFNDPTQALGGPTGAGAFAGSTTGLFNLGVGGSITLGFGTADAPATVTDGPGADFIVFENPFFLGGSPAQSFAELIRVEVSSNGIDFAAFVPEQTPVATTVGAFTVIDPATAGGFAGVGPVLANVDDPLNTVDPFDPAAAGGDAFDLTDLLTATAVIDGLVNLNAISSVRLTDVPGLDGTSSFDNGADLDGLAVVNGAVPEPASLWTLLVFTGLAAASRRRRH